MATTTIPAIDWEFDHDVDDAVSAGRFRATYRSVLADRTWDSSIYSGVRIYQRQDSPDFVQILASVEGTQLVVVEGVCDSHTLRDSAAGSIGVVAGRDKMAILLDRRPTGSFVYNSNALQSLPLGQFTRLIQNPPSPDIATILFGAAIINGQPAPNTNFYSAVGQLMRTVGVPFIIHPGVPNYSLGPSIAVTRDKFYAEYLAQLLRPLRISEKHRVDALADPSSGMVHVVQRDNSPFPAVVMGHACFKECEFEKTGLPNWPTVRFQGFSWRSPVRVEQGLSGVTLPVTTFEEVLDNESLVYTLQTTAWANAAGLEVKKYEKKSYTADPLNGALSGVTEETLTAKEYNEVLGDAAYGLLVRSQFTVTKTTPLSGGPYVVKDVVDRFDYWPETIQPLSGASSASVGSGFPAGSLKTKTSIQLEYNDPWQATTVISSPGSPSVAVTNGVAYALVRKTTTVETISQSSQQIIRNLRTIVQDASGNVTTTQDIQDLGPFKIVGGKGGPVQGQGTVMTQMWVLSGPIDVAGKPLPLVVSDEMVADQVTADLIHGWLVDEYASVRVRVRALVQPDIRIKPGRVMQVTGAPSRWPVTSWYVTSVRMRSRGMWEVQGTAWL